MNYLKISLGIFVVLAVSRFVPHPPNFTTLVALSFYVPAVLGLKFIPVLMFAFFITDIYFGFHSTLFFTWGSVLIIGLVSKFFNKSIIFRISGALIGAIIFYLVSNFGVWIASDYYENNINGLIICYYLALPFFGYTLMSTTFYSFIIEICYLIVKKKFRYKF